MQEYKNRNEVPEKYKWDLTPFFKNEEEFNKTLKETEEKVTNLEKSVGCTKSASSLKEFLENWTEAISNFEDLFVYAYLINDQELGNSKSIERKNKAHNLGAKLEKNTSFFAPELLKLEKNEFEKLVQDESLKDFKSELEKVYRDKEHILSESEEKIISELVNAMDHFDDMSSTMLNSEHDYGKIKIDKEVVTIASNNYRKLMKNKDEKIRKRVYTLYNKKLAQYGASSASFLNGYVSSSCAMAKIRNFKSSWDNKLFSLNMPDKVFKTLVKTTEKNLDSLQKYYTLKKEKLGLETLHPYDLNLEMETNDKVYSIEDAREIITKAIEPLGTEYNEKFAKIFKNRYIDYCQYKGKCSGGYSYATMNQDSRILMSFNNDLNSVSTVAHEGGHNVHHQFLKEYNLMQYRSAASIVAEVCSLTNECLLSNYLYEHGETKEEKLAGLSNIMGVIVSNLFGAVREGKLEEDMYKEVENGGSITQELMNKLTRKSLKKYYGNTVKLDKYVDNSWITRSHYYMHFYLYSYSICISVATNVASEILKGNKEMLENYIEFMKVGSDKWPIDAFKVLGVDLESESVYQNAINYFDELIEKYYKVWKEEE